MLSSLVQLFQLPPTAYVREIVFIDPPSEGKDPKATMMSVNLSLAQYMYVKTSYYMVYRLTPR